MVNEKEVLEILNETTDPEIGIGIVDLGLIAQCDIEGDYVRIAVRTTTPRCPFQPFIMMEAHRKLMTLAGVRGVEVEVTHDSPWHPDMMTDVAKSRLGFYPSRLELASQQVPEIQVSAAGKK
jgi:metal-sulfur cluster biosynthetic enzyme